MKSARFLSRMAAQGIDFLICLILILVFVFLSFLAFLFLVPMDYHKKKWFMFGFILYAIVLWSILIPFLYYTIAIKFYGQTLGKRLFTIKVVSDTGGPVSFARSVSRFLAYFLTIGTFWISFFIKNSNGRPIGLHDSISKTHVISIGKSNRSGEILTVILMVFLIALIVWTATLWGSAWF